MGSVALVDANVCLRVLLKDTTHPKYSFCVEFLRRPCVIESYVFPEIVYAVCTRVRKDIAFQLAAKLGEAELFMAAPRKYMERCTPPAGWRKGAYVELYKRVQDLRRCYPEVRLYDERLYTKTVEVAIATGHDWVDCTLIANNLLYEVPIYSIDSDVIKSLSPKTGLPSMNLFRK